MNTLKATVEQRRNMFGKKAPGQFVATLPGTGWECTGNTKDNALDGLRDALKKQEEWLHTRCYVRKGNVTFALYYANGWTYDIVRDQSPHDLPLRRSMPCVMLQSKTYADALEEMVKHAQAHDGV